MQVRGWAVGFMKTDAFAELVELEQCAFCKPRLRSCGVSSGPVRVFFGEALRQSGNPTRGNGAGRGDLNACRLDQGAILQVLSGLYSVMGLAISAVCGPRFFSNTIPSWFTTKVITPESPYFAGKVTSANPPVICPFTI